MRFSLKGAGGIEVRSLLGLPQIFRGYQWLVGAERAKEAFVSVVLNPQPGQTVVDVGCGTGELCKYFPRDVRYVGLDIDRSYIRFARQRFGGRGEFLLGDVSAFELAETVDAVVAFGVLHHMKDDEVRMVSSFARRVLSSGGRFLTVDPTLGPGQPWIERAMKRYDRGRFIRDGQGYRLLLSAEWPDAGVRIGRGLMNVPYDLAICEVVAG